MKPTKKPKHAKMKLEPVTRYVSSYTCPTCNVRFVGTGHVPNILRFRCDCGQELIIDMEEQK